MSTVCLTWLLWGIPCVIAEIVSNSIAHAANNVNEGLGNCQTAESLSLLQRSAKPHQTHPSRSASPARRIPNKLLLNYKEHRTGKALPEDQINLKHTFDLHPDMEVIFSDDSDCYKSLLRMHSRALARDFLNESTRMFQSDICRLAMLYEHGGYYLDGSLELLKDVRAAIPADASISTILALPRANTPNTIFNAFIAAAPRHQVIMDAMDGTWAWYSGKHRLSESGTNLREQRPIGTEVLGESLLKWLGATQLKVQRQYRNPHLEKGKQVDTNEFAYLFTESEEGLEKYKLKKRHGRGESCNVAVVDGGQALAWSRFVGSSEWCDKIEEKGKNQSPVPDRGGAVELAGKKGKRVQQLTDGRHIASPLGKAVLKDSPVPTYKSYQSQIPDNILFNYKENLLIRSGTVKYPDLQRNVRSIIQQHPGMQVIFYDNHECSRAIKRVHSEALAKYFDNEDTGMFKSDICRLAMLYEHGGYYFDNDIEMLTDVRKVLPIGVSLSSVVALPRCNRPNAIFQAFTAVVPRHPAVKDALDGTLQWYRNKVYEDVGELPPGYMRLMGTEVLGESVMKWLEMDTLRPGRLHRQNSKPSLQEGEGHMEYAYFFEEAEEDLDRYGLQKREGIGGSCNVYVKDFTEAIAWSRFVGSGQWCEKPDKDQGATE